METKGLSLYRLSQVKTTNSSRNLVAICAHYVFVFQRQYHSQIDNLIEETVKEMITLLVAKVPFKEYKIPKLCFYIYIELLPKKVKEDFNLIKHNVGLYSLLNLLKFLA